MDADDPVLIEITRGPLVESRHRGAAAVVDAAGGLVAAWGEVERPVYPRSAIKPVQALPLIETGAADRFRLSVAELALATASHVGTPRHVMVAREWIARLGIPAMALRCGTHPPRDEAAARDLWRAGQAPLVFHHNCAGKHLGILTTALHREEPVADYLAPDHPAQRRITAAIADLAGADPAHAPVGTDGCGIPTLGIPLRALARAMAMLAAPDRLAAARGAAARRIVAAMVAEPELVRGPGQFDSRVIAAGAGAVVTKTGAEGVHVAILPGRGLGVALKIADGAKRAAECAMATVLRALMGGAAALDLLLFALADQPVHNDAGRVVGRIVPATDWAADVRAANSGRR